jgi:ribonuclease Z
VTLNDGSTVGPEQVLESLMGGQKLVVVGDVESSDGLASHWRDADLL